MKRRAPRFCTTALASRRSITLLAPVILFACGGGSSPAGPTPSAGTGRSGPTLSRLELFPAERVAVVGDTLTTRVIARDLAGADVPNVVPTFSSSNPGVVRLESDGRVQAIGPGTATLRATSGGQTAETMIHVGPATYDLGQGPLQVLSANYIDLSKVERISRFRSAIGHSYVDGSGESCRSMKHYYQPRQSVDWRTVDIYAPASGTIWLIATDGAAGFRILLRPRDLPALEVAIFHVNLDPGIVRDIWVNAGDRIGRHASPFTMSDIATSIGGKEQGTLISYFQTMTDAVFADTGRVASPRATPRSSPETSATPTRSHAQASRSLRCRANCRTGLSSTNAGQQDCRLSRDVS